MDLTPQEKDWYKKTFGAYFDGRVGRDEMFKNLANLGYNNLNVIEFMDALDKLKKRIYGE